MKIDLQKIRSILISRKNKVLVAIFGGLVLVTVFMAYSFNENNAARPEQGLTIPAMGNLRSLDIMMAENKNIRDRVKQILSYDEAYLFVNYRQINGSVAEILFLWSGIKPAQLQKMKSREAIDYFLRFVYGLPKDEPIENNPLLGTRPWPTLFNRFKSRLLMQGQGYKIYDGVAYYDNQNDRMVVKGQLSKAFVNGFAKFLKGQKEKDRKRFINNFLFFVDQTKGLRNLSDEEKAIISFNHL